MANDFAAPKKKKNKALLFGLVGVGLLATTIGGVFATNSITINSGGTIEFGQGLASTSTCDSALTTSVTQEYDAAADMFYAKTVIVSGIQDFSCNGKNLNVSLVGASGTVCSVDGTHTSGANQDSFLIVDGGTVGTDDDLQKEVTIPAACDATTITKVAITTS